MKPPGEVPHVLGEQAEGLRLVATVLTDPFGLPLVLEQCVSPDQHLHLRRSEVLHGWRKLTSLPELLRLLVRLVEEVGRSIGLDEAHASVLHDVRNLLGGEPAVQLAGHADVEAVAFFAWLPHCGTLVRGSPSRSSTGGLGLQQGLKLLLGIGIGVCLLGHPSIVLFLTHGLQVLRPQRHVLHAVNLHRPALLHLIVLYQHAPLPV
mmetsp:Transcript_7107/g.19780  ORF Transcript_7107/g.19780 Transcript_7107/m.19780 type:complete len:206 (+) Transcript_7107:882-1499(+)